MKSKIEEVIKAARDSNEKVLASFEKMLNEIEKGKRFDKVNSKIVEIEKPKINAMEIKLDRDDILKELTNSCGNDVPFLCQIIDRCTNNWEPYRDVVKGLLSNLITNEEMSDIEEYIIKLKRNK